MATSTRSCPPDRSCLSRRAALAVGTGGAGMVVLAACGSDEGGDDTTSAAAGGVIANVSDIPVGGAIAATTAAGDGILLTQPTEGEIHALSDICTHAGCTVEPADGELDCPCHGSVFDLTGAVLQGPAGEPLPEVEITVAEDGSITG